MSNAIVSGIRTAVAVIVAAVLSWLVSHYGFHVSKDVADQISVVAFGLICGVYTAAVNWLSEHVNPSFGFLLGIPRHPVYAPKGS